MRYLLKTTFLNSKIIYIEIIRYKCANVYRKLSIFGGFDVDFIIQKKHPKVLDLNNWILILD